MSSYRFRHRRWIVDGAIGLCTALILLNYWLPRGVRLTPKLAPPLAIQTPSGTLTLQEYKRHVVLLDFFATWCLPCRLSIPHIERLYHQFHKQGLIVLGVALDDDPHRMSAFLRQLGVTYPAGPVLDRNSLSTYKVQTIPLVILVDKEGKLRWRQEGFSFRSEQELSQQIKTLLKERSF